MKLIIALITCIFMNGCIESDSESEQNSKPTTFRYGILVRIKSGFYEGYGCAVIREYEKEVFCKISLTPVGLTVRDEWQINQNFKKNNVDLWPLDEE